MDKVAKTLAREAKRKGICPEWHEELKGLRDKREMVRMYVRGIDFCLSNDYPSNDFIREHFKGVMELEGVFLDDEISLDNPRRCIALGETKGRLLIDGYHVCEVFAKHNSHIRIETDGDAFVTVDMFDASMVDVCSRGSSMVQINHYGGSLQVEEQQASHIKIIQKDKPHY